MAEKAKTVCPTCAGKGVVPGTCECNHEWRGNKNDDDWEDCRCVKEVKCAECQGTGYL